MHRASGLAERTHQRPRANIACDASGVKRGEVMQRRRAARLRGTGTHHTHDAAAHARAMHAAHGAFVLPRMVGETKELGADAGQRRRFPI